MRPPARRCILAAALAIWSLGCARTPSVCSTAADCGEGWVCVDRRCTEADCGDRCESGQVCRVGQCRDAEAAPCGEDVGACPPSFLCTPIGQCARRCTLDQDCATPAFPSCHVELGICGECTFDRECASSPDRPICAADSARCVGCLANDDCLGPNGTPSGMVCDRQAMGCVPGCSDDSECPRGGRCDVSTDFPGGRCVQCDPSTETKDCVDAPHFRCHPGTRMCVECLEHAQCPFGCNTTTHECIRCTNGTCDNGGDCVVDGDCPRSMICDLSASRPRCISGCVASHSGQADETRCRPPAGITPVPKDVHCDPARNNGRGRCVECRPDTGGDCEGSMLCDQTNATCRCRIPGEPCVSVNDCGTMTGQCTTYSPTSGRTCIAEVECTGSWTVSVSPVCAVAPSNGQCDIGYIPRYATDLKGNRRYECVPAEACP